MCICLLLCLHCMFYVCLWLFAECALVLWCYFVHGQAYYFFPQCACILLVLLFFRCSLQMSLFFGIVFIYVTCNVSEFDLLSDSVDIIQFTYSQLVYMLFVNGVCGQCNNIDRWCHSYIIVVCVQCYVVRVVDIRVMSVECAFTSHVCFGDVCSLCLMLRN